MVVQLSLVDKVKVLFKSYWSWAGVVVLFLALKLYFTNSIQMDVRIFFGLLLTIASILLLKQGYKRLAALEFILSDFTLTTAELWENEATELSIESVVDDGSGDERRYHQLSYLYVIDEAPYYDHYLTSTPESHKKIEPLIYSNTNPFECTLLFKLPHSIEQQVLALPTSLKSE